MNVTRRNLMLGTALSAAALALPVSAFATPSAKQLGTYMVLGFQGDAPTNLMLGRLTDTTFSPELWVESYRDNIMAEHPELKAEFLAFLERAGYKWPLISALEAFGQAYFGAPKQVLWAKGYGWNTIGINNLGTRKISYT
jgi:hypothetical protein